MPQLLISAAHKSSGKTTISLGLCAALTARGIIVQPFKKGPDYIDPLWLTQAANRSCHNLDFYTMNAAEIRHNFAQHSLTADISLIEGNKGLYDGMDVKGSNNNAALAHLLGAPVVLVIETQGMTRGVAPLILGYQLFDKNTHIAGVIFNQVGGERHESKLRESMEYHTDVPVIGAVRRDSRLVIKERHLGLMPNNEDNQAQNKINTIAELIAAQVNLEQLHNIAQQATPALHSSKSTIRSQRSLHKPDIRIGIIRDAAFGFYYAGDLEALEAAGAELVFIDALHDSQLPAVDALFIGGGFPETQMEQLSNNNSLKKDIRAAIERAMPVYAECGGLMYLSRQLTWRGKTAVMVGALPFDTVMEARPQGRGYVHLRETGHGLWPLLDSAEQPAEFYAHEFHYSKTINLPANLTFAYQVLRGHGVNGSHDGVIYKNTLASYIHLRDVENNPWTQRFVEFARKHKQSLSLEN
ncbi:MAG TPA: hydrogenobyrinic acid a,c-diamide synthase (glutamine-hydrolyzing) [Thioploca sp.]|nr:MAG: cobyrinic acid a,c-diamide synthase [Gammaproteobacteria bacterium]HDN25989.1 hydrogenobyrinic acid a,c-diamide synthase (glutamine-hydrolyzing) [Thioploca sp.]